MSVGGRRAPRGARELKLVSLQRRKPHARRAPRGARELKHLENKHEHLGISRAPRGARELKRKSRRMEKPHKRRAPRGARELKPHQDVRVRVVSVVLREGHVN